MPYTAPTLAEARTALALRLDDASMVRWIAAELDVYLVEALRTWQAWTAHWRAPAVFNTDGSTFYELGAVLPTLRAMTVTNWDLVAAIEYHLLEPPTPTAWTGTAQFTLPQVTTAIQRRRDLFLALTGAVLARTVTAYAGVNLPADGALPLDASVMQIRRAAWRPAATGFLAVLPRADEWGGDHFKPDWRTRGTPQAYSTAGAPPITLQLMPPADLDGDLDLIAIARGADIVAAPAVEVPLGIPDDWAWVVKFGALADLFNGDGLARDAARAAYCENRWRQGISMAMSAAVVLSATLDGAAAEIGTLSDADSYSPTWQLLQGAPLRVVTAGQNLITTWPVAGGVTVVGLVVVRNAPVPAADGDVLQVGADLYDTILDIAQHLAALKEGAQQLEDATSLLQRAGDVAGVNLALQQATQPNRTAMAQTNRLDTIVNPQQVDPVEVP